MPFGDASIGTLLDATEQLALRYRKVSVGRGPGDV